MAKLERKFQNESIFSLFGYMRGTPSEKVKEEIRQELIARDSSFAIFFHPEKELKFKGVAVDVVNAYFARQNAFCDIMNNDTRLKIYFGFSVDMDFTPYKYSYSQKSPKSKLKNIFEMRALTKFDCDFVDYAENWKRAYDKQENLKRNSVSVEDDISKKVHESKNSKPKAQKSAQSKTIAKTNATQKSNEQPQSKNASDKEEKTISKSLVGATSTNAPNELDKEVLNSNKSVDISVVNSEAKISSDKNIEKKVNKFNAKKVEKLRQTQSTSSNQNVAENKTIDNAFLDKIVKNQPAKTKIEMPIKTTFNIEIEALPTTQNSQSNSENSIIDENQYKGKSLEEIALIMERAQIYAEQESERTFFVCSVAGDKSKNIEDSDTKVVATTQSKELSFFQVAPSGVNDAMPSEDNAIEQDDTKKKLSMFEIPSEM